METVIETLLLLVRWVDKQRATFYSVASRGQGRWDEAEAWQQSLGRKCDLASTKHKRHTQRKPYQQPHSEGDAKTV